MDGSSNTEVVSQVQADGQGVVSTAADEIDEAYRLACEAAESSVDHAIRCGELLIAQKKRLRHGEFQSWVDTNLVMSYDTAARWMRMARLDRQKLSACNFSSVAQALEYDKNERRPKDRIIKKLPKLSQTVKADARVLFVDVCGLLAAADHEVTGAKVDPFTVVSDGMRETDRKKLSPLVNRQIAFWIRFRAAMGGSRGLTPHELDDAGVDEEVADATRHLCPQPTAAEATLQ